MAKIFIADEMSDIAKQVIETYSTDENPLTVVKKVKLSEENLIQEIGKADALLVRSATTVTRKVMEAGKNLKVIGRAGVGVDNIDVQAATEMGIVVMNVPLGNAITTAEHALTLLLSMAREIPFADHSMHDGRWEKSAIKGTEVQGKTLGILGCGNIGKIVAQKAIGFGLKVLVYDPYITEDVVKRLGVEVKTLEELLAVSDFITSHLPLNDKTYHILNRDRLKKAKKGIRIINCSRGGIVDEDALCELLESGDVAAAALDVFEKEPLPKDSPLLRAKNLILTPHLGGSTIEAQERVVEGVARQACELLLHGEISNAVNVASLSAQEHKALVPYQTLVTQLSTFLGQIIESGIRKIIIEYQGDSIHCSTNILTLSILQGILSQNIAGMNTVNAMQKVHQRGIEVEERKNEFSEEYHTLVGIKVYTDISEYTIKGTLLGAFPRIVSLKEIAVEAELGTHNLYVINKDRPGFISQITDILSTENINIASFHLGRKEKSGEAVSIVVCDEQISSEILQKIESLEMVSFARVIQI